MRLVVARADRWDVRRLLEIADAARGAASPDELSAAIGRYGAPPLPEWHGAEWLAPLNRACQEAITRLRGVLADRLLADGRHDDARVQFSQLAEAEPDEEVWHRGLMRCHAAAGETALALRQYHVCRSTLRQTRSADPSAETQRLYLELLSAR